MAGEGSAATIENAAALEQDNKAKVDNWVKQADGAAETAAAKATLAAETAAPAPAAAAAAAPAAPAAAAAAAAPAAAAPAAGASAQAVQDFIDALIGEGETPETLKIPANARIPLEVNGKVEYVTAAELRKRGMLEADYRVKTTEVAEARRELEDHATKLIADRARMDARERSIAEERKRLRDAQKSPEAWERYQNHLRLLEEDPDYAKTFEDALDGRERKAEEEAIAAARHVESVGAGVAQAAAWILEVGRERKFEHVDLDRVRERFAAELEAGRSTLDRGAVERIFQSEADQAQSAVGPLQQKIAELDAQVAALKGATDAAAHNRNTEHALARAAAVPVTTGLPAAPAPADRKVKPFTPRELPDVNREWASRRD